MKKISTIGLLLKKIYRIYSSDLLQKLQDKGFTDLRPSFIEVMIFVCEHQGPSIKEIGEACGLKKQTMTSHLNELYKRGYIVRKSGVNDKRTQNVFLTEHGETFKLNLIEAIDELDREYISKIGEVEMDRIELSLSSYLSKITPPTTK